MVKHYRNTHSTIAREVYEKRRTEFRPLINWLPDAERLRALGEFEFDEKLIKAGWGGGVDKKFYAVSSKYSVSHVLNNPVDGALACTRTSEGATYKLHERIERLVQEFSSAVGIWLG